MPNLYKATATIHDLIDEEDRECDNDLKRAKTKYYDSLTEINKIYLQVLKSMNREEIKQVILNNPIRRM